MTSSLVLYWLKRDFRLANNTALTPALEINDQVVPVFILESILLQAPETSVFHLHAINNALQELRKIFQKKNTVKPSSSLKYSSI